MTIVEKIKSFLLLQKTLEDNVFKPIKPIAYPAKVLFIYFI
ncbi:MAG: hypothetical protein RLZZ499_784 [Cyanobacteriota bacterium]|jgi:hypothetical protein